MNINSGTMNFAGVRAVGAAFRSEFDGLGFKTEWVDGTPFAARYRAVPSVSVDYAVMGRAADLEVLSTAFDWDDLGAWPALARHVKQDSEGNAAVADLVHVDASRNIVFDNRTKGRTPITLVGVKDCIIVLTDDATLVAAKSEAQKIKDLVKKLAADPKRAHLV